MGPITSSRYSDDDVASILSDTDVNLTVIDLRVNNTDCKQAVASNDELNNTQTFGDGVQMSTATGDIDQSFNPYSDANGNPPSLPLLSSKDSIWQCDHDIILHHPTPRKCWNEVSFIGCPSPSPNRTKIPRSASFDSFFAPNARSRRPRVFKWNIPPSTMEELRTNGPWLLEQLRSATPGDEKIETAAEDLEAILKFYDVEISSSGGGSRNAHALARARAVTHSGAAPSAQRRAHFHATEAHSGISHFLMRRLRSIGPSILDRFRIGGRFRLH